MIDHRILAALVIASTCMSVGACTQADQPERDDSFSVMTWNAEWFYDEFQGDNYSDLAKEKSAPSREDWNWRRDAFADAIAQVAPSVVALQEIEGQRVLWYLTRALQREHRLQYRELAIQGGDHFTEQDVGFLYRRPVDAVSVSRQMQTEEMFRSEKYLNLTKHLFAEFRVPAGDSFETVTVLNLHLRAKPENEHLRRRQALLAHVWVAQAVRRGDNLIVLGDFNTEHDRDSTLPQTDLGSAVGLDTPDQRDDLVDVTLRIPSPLRKTHLLGKQFDRILVSPSLLRDDPSKPDLVFESIEVRRDLAVRRGLDDPDEHWERYWQMNRESRDLSDHFPVIAKFQVR